MSNLNRSRFSCVVIVLCFSCLTMSAQEGGSIDQRIRELVVAIHPEYSTSNYRLSIAGQRMIGLTHPVENWFFSLAPYPDAPGVGHVYDQTSTPCGQYENSFPEGTCVLPRQDDSKRVLLGRMTLGMRGQVAVEVSSPLVTELNSRLKSSLPEHLSRDDVQKLLATSGAKFPPSNNADFVLHVTKSPLLPYLHAKLLRQPRFCLYAQHAHQESSRQVAIYWQVILRGTYGGYLAIFEPFEGGLTSLVPMRGSEQVAESCQDEQLVLR